MDTHWYSDQDWAVRRWDSFNGGAQVTPTSFCQFWRTILLWATLASIPIIGRWLFLTHLIEKPPTKTWDSEAHERRVTAIRKVVVPPATFVWRLLWPVRIVLYSAWRATATVIAFVDERDTSGLERALYKVLLLLTGGAVVALLIMLGFILAAAWMASWPIFLATALGVPLTLASAGFVAMRFGPSIASAVASFFRVVWNVAVASKHRICPPMVIDRTS